MNSKHIFTILLVGLIAISCRNNPLDVDTSNVNMDLSFINVDSILFNTNETDLIASNNRFKKEINEVYSYNIGYCMQMLTILFIITILTQKCFQMKVLTLQL